MTNKEELIRLAELCGYEQKLNNMFSHPCKDSMHISSWNPFEKIEQAIECLDKFDRVFLNKFGDLWQAEIYAYRNCFKFESADLSQAICKAILKAMEVQL